MVVRTVRELGQLGFFDAENINPDFKNVDPNAGTVDIEYGLTEAGASQIELQGGYGGGGFIGTLGLSFNNFSLKNIFNFDTYKPLPMGDGQNLSLRLRPVNFSAHIVSVLQNHGWEVVNQFSFQLHYHIPFNIVMTF